jgi:hypothetical protein
VVHPSPLALKSLINHAVLLLPNQRQGLPGPRKESSLPPSELLPEDSAFSGEFGLVLHLFGFRFLSL